MSEQSTTRRAKLRVAFERALGDLKSRQDLLGTDWHAALEVNAEALWQELTATDRLEQFSNALWARRQLAESAFWLRLTLEPGNGADLAVEVAHFYGSES